MNLAILPSYQTRYTKTEIVMSVELRELISAIGASNSTCFELDGRCVQLNITDCVDETCLDSNIKGRLGALNTQYVNRELSLYEIFSSKLF